MKERDFKAEKLTSALINDRSWLGRAILVRGAKKMYPTACTQPHNTILVQRS